jgi:hypothetical protein
VADVRATLRLKVGTEIAPTVSSEEFTLLNVEVIERSKELKSDHYTELV